MSASREKHRRQDLKSSPDYKPVGEKKHFPKWAARLIWISALVLAVLAIGWTTLNAGVLNQYVPAMHVNGESVTVAEYNYYLNSTAINYTNYVNQLYGNEITGLTPDMQVGLKQQWLDELNKETWADYFHEQTVNDIRDIVSLAQRAREAGLTLDSDDKSYVDAQISSLRDFATQYQTSSVKVLAANYGRGVTTAIYRKVLERSLLAQKYESYYDENIDTGDAALDAYYDTHAGDVDEVDFRMFSFTATAPALEDETGLLEVSQAEQDEADAVVYGTVRAKAEEMIGKITSSSDFNTYAREYAPEDSTEDYDDPETGLAKNYIRKDLPEALAEWLYDSARTQGELGIVELKDSAEKVTTVYVLMFLDRKRGDYETIDVRHLLVTFEKDSEDAEPTEEQKTAAREKAQAYLDEYLAGEQSEGAFAALATAHSEDTGSQSAGGLYENVALNTMVAPFEDWIYASARRPGDTGLVESSFGYHVMYFVGKGETRWKLLASGQMHELATEELNAAMEAEAVISQSGFGMFFSGTK